MPSKPDIAARDRIIETALNLFYKQSYLATGINQIIAESQVAKPPSMLISLPRVPCASPISRTGISCG